MPIYVADASALIFAKNEYPPENFGPLWDRLHEMNLQEKLIIIKKVKDELKAGNDYLSKEFLEGKKFSDDEQQDVVENFPRIMNKLPKDNMAGFSNWLKVADPYVIAYAMKLINLHGKDEVIVLHGEVERGNKIRIPRVCRLLDIKNGRLSVLIKEEKIRFSIQ